MAEQQNDNLLPKGFRFFNPTESAPDFVMGTLVVTPREFFDYVTQNQQYLTEYEGKKQLKIQLLLSKSGKLYGKVDDYKKEDVPAGKKPPRPGSATNEETGNVVGTAAPTKEDLNDLPF